MPARSNYCDIERTGNKDFTTYKPYDDSNIDSNEQVRDLGIMIGNTATFTFHIRNIVKKAQDCALVPYC